MTRPRRAADLGDGLTGPALGVRACLADPAVCGGHVDRAASVARTGPAADVGQCLIRPPPSPPGPDASTTCDTSPLHRRCPGAGHSSSNVLSMPFDVLDGVGATRAALHAEGCLALIDLMWA
ncbi:MAG: hypothetical protein ACRDRV_08170 [Pseudonocardiaceae bacterium]